MSFPISLGSLGSLAPIAFGNHLMSFFGYRIPQCTGSFKVWSYKGDIQLQQGYWCSVLVESSIEEYKYLSSFDTDGPNML